MLKKSASLEKAEVKVEAERGSDCPHLSLSLDLSLSRGYPARCYPVVPDVQAIEVPLGLYSFSAACERLALGLLGGYSAPPIKFL